MLKRDHQLVLPTQARAPGFRVELRGTTFRLIATGAWTVAEATELDKALKRLRVPIPPTPDFTGEMDIAGIAEIDTAGAWLLQRTAASWQAGGLRTHYAGATESFRILIEEVHRRGRAQRPEIEKPNPVTKMVEDTIRALTGFWRDAVQLTAFLGEVTAAFLRLFRQPWRFRTTSFFHHLDHAGLRAVPIIALICFLIGAVVMQQGVVQLRPFGAEPFAVNMVAILALREVGILLTAIMVAGRSGSAFTAEIGSMKMREEIDAMRTLGIDPMDTLVLPRVLALVVALPLLTFLGDLMGLAGGGVMAFAVLGLDSSTYVDKLHEAIDFQHFLAGMIKAPFAAVIIGLVGCLEGLRVEGSAESLGTHVTSAVVKAIFLVIILDAVFAMFLSGIGV
jgi:phospholipid/cholesterol/gamma-HCH transport system permease protein